ncbi:MAG: hypothetical protein OXL34_17695 [Gemmatimonadota bacterium]|nr:hypothetical protein [Gemmatimonadota bacterium]
MTSVMTTPSGEMNLSVGSSATVELTFAADPAGVLVSGNVSDYSARLSSSMMPTTEIGSDDLSGNLEFVIGPMGDTEVKSMPRVTGPPMLFRFNPYDLFPRFPGHRLEPGDTWVDTVTASADQISLGALPATAENTTVYTYTRVGDTVVAGRTLQKIQVSALGRSQHSREVAGGTVSQDMTNTLEGFALWDAGRGLVAVLELVRTVDGSTSMQGRSMPIAMAGPLSLRLVAAAAPSRPPDE